MSIPGEEVKASYFVRITRLDQYSRISTLSQGRLPSQLGKNGLSHICRWEEWIDIGVP